MDEYRWKAGGDVLKAFAAALLLILSAPAQAGDARTAQAVDRWSIHIREASARFGVPEEWIRRVMRAESGGRTTLDGRPITSHAGAMGLMQLMPGTWAEMRDLHGLGSDPHDPRDNILAGTAYLRAMYKRFGYPELFAAYNAGPRRYAEHLTTGRHLPAETIAYSAALRRPLPQASAAPRSRRFGNPIFVALAAPGRSDGWTASAAAARHPLFVRLSAASAEPR